MTPEQSKELAKYITDFIFRTYSTLMIWSFCIVLIGYILIKLVLGALEALELYKRPELTGEGKVLKLVEPDTTRTPYYKPIIYHILIRHKNNAAMLEVRSDIYERLKEGDTVGVAYKIGRA